jgi:hypothetical protein
VNARDLLKVEFLISIRVAELSYVILSKQQLHQSKARQVVDFLDEKLS